MAPGDETLDETLEDVLRAAVAAVDAAGVPDDLRGVAFSKAVELLSGQSEDAPAAAGGPPTKPKKTDQLDAMEDSIGSIASALSLDRPLIDETYYLDNNGTVRLSIGSAKLSNADQDAQQELALLLTAGRQSAGKEVWTKSKVIREAASEYGKMNHHFAESISEMDDEFSFKGKGPSRELKLRIVGRERAAALIKRIQGVDQD